jgi:hypothetical protein
VTSWQVQDAKARFSELPDATIKNGPSGSYAPGYRDGRSSTNPGVAPSSSPTKIRAAVRLESVVRLFDLRRYQSLCALESLRPCCHSFRWVLKKLTALHIDTVELGTGNFPGDAQALDARRCLRPCRVSGTCGRPRRHHKRFEFAEKCYAYWRRPIMP